MQDTFQETVFSSRLKEQNAYRADIQELQNKLKSRRLTYFSMCENTKLTSVGLSIKYLWAQRAKKLVKRVAKKQSCFELEKENDEGPAAIT